MSYVFLNIYNAKIAKINSSKVSDGFDVTCFAYVRFIIIYRTPMSVFWVSSEFDEGTLSTSERFIDIWNSIIREASLLPISIGNGTGFWSILQTTTSHARTTTVNKDSVDENEGQSKHE